MAESYTPTFNSKLFAEYYWSLPNNIQVIYKA